MQQLGVRSEGLDQHRLGPATSGRPYIAGRKDDDRRPGIERIDISYKISAQAFAKCKVQQHQAKTARAKTSAGLIEGGGKLEGCEILRHRRNDTLNVGIVFYMQDVRLAGRKAGNSAPQAANQQGFVDRLFKPARHREWFLTQLQLPLRRHHRDHHHRQTAGFFIASQGANKRYALRARHAIACSAQ